MIELSLIQVLFKAFFNTIGTYDSIQIPKWIYFPIPVHYDYLKPIPCSFNFSQQTLGGSKKRSGGPQPARSSFLKRKLHLAKKTLDALEYQELFHSKQELCYPFPRHLHYIIFKSMYYEVIFKRINKILKKRNQFTKLQKFLNGYLYTRIFYFFPFTKISKYWKLITGSNKVVICNLQPI